MSGRAADASARRERLGHLLRQRATLKTVPLTPAQRRLWFLEQLYPGEPTYHIPTVQRLDGRVDKTALEQALNAVVARHEALRSVVLVEDGEPRQRILPSMRVRLTCVEVAGDGERLADVLADEARRPFDLANGPLLRATLARTAANGSYLALTVHHLVADGWSLLVVNRELGSLYHASVHGLPDELEPVPLQYADYAGWLDQQLRSGAFDAALDHFRAELDGAPPWIALPSEQSPETLADRRGAVHRFEIGEDLVRELRALVAAENATLYMGLLAAFGVLLHRLSGQDDVVVGSPVANRDRLELEEAVGLYANVVVRRLRLAGAPSFRELVRQARDRVLAALPFQDLPFERLVEALNPPRDLTRNPVFQVLFTFQNTPAPSRPPDGAPAAPRVTTAQAQFDLAWTVQELRSTLRCSFEYSGLFSPQRIERMTGMLVRLLAAAAREPDVDVTRLPLLGEVERAAAIRAGDGGPAAEGASPVAAIAGLAETSPTAPAVFTDAGAVTFEELEDRVAAWAARLDRAGIGLGDPVLVSGPRTADLVAVFLAVARLGAVYVPVDPGLPAARVALMADAVRPRAVVSPSSAEDRGGALDVPWLALDDPPAEPDRLGLRDVPDEAVAYVVFTSGSTGRPKPVAIGRGAMERHSRALQQQFPLGPGDRVLLLTSIGFDASVFELLGPLAAGASLAAVLPHSAPYAPEAVVEAIARHRITALQVVPSVLRALLDEPGLDRCRHLRRVYCGGEVLTAELARRFQARSDAALLNMYGPTETAIDATCWPGPTEEGTGSVPIGLPIPGVRAVVVDRHLEPVPDGVAGELLVGGCGVAHGYLGDPALTADRFRPDPFGPPGSRAYLTGDVVRRRADGAVEFAGRRDDQVKVRGVRVELGEIEAALRSHPAIADAVAGVVAADGGAKLFAGVVTATEVAEDALRRHLLETLPLGLLPSTIERLAEIPVGSSGKVDRAAALALIERSGAAADGEPPLPGPERRLAELWRDLLGVPEVRRQDSFFDLGGHSLLATRLTNQVRLAFGVDLPLRELFANPTLAATAAWLAARQERRTDVRG